MMHVAATTISVQNLLEAAGGGIGRCGAVCFVAPSSSAFGGVRRANLRSLSSHLHTLV
jgi:hypothetical protein